MWVRARRKLKYRFIPSLERLEDRTVPTIFTVSNLAQLQADILVAQNYDEILMNPGVYSTVGALTNAIDADNVSVNLTIKANGAGVVVDGGDSNTLLFMLDPNGNPGTQIQFNGITFQNGNSPNATLSGGITLSNASATFTDCTFTSNVNAVGQGGGAFLITGDSTAQFNSCTWTNNSSTADGGAMNIHGVPGTPLSVTIDDGTFIGNNTTMAGAAATTNGGAISAEDANLTVNNSSFTSNSCNFTGGALYVIGEFIGSAPYTPTANLNVNNSTFTSNTSVRNSADTEAAGAVQAGAIMFENAGGNIQLSRFLDNSAEQGGAIEIYRSVVSIDQSYFQFNIATNSDGGAIGIGSVSGPNDFGKTKGTLTITNSFIEGDPAGKAPVAQAGGGIVVEGDVFSEFGGGGVPINGTTAQNQAQLTVNNVVFQNLIVQEVVGVPGTGNGGAISSDLGNLNISNAMFINDQAYMAHPTSTVASGGGALGLLQGTTMSLTNSILSNNTSDRSGGAIFAFGTNMTIDTVKFLDNSVSPSDLEVTSYGAAIASASTTVGSDVFDAQTVVRNSVFSMNQGVPIYEFDTQPSSTPNEMTYVNNQFYGTAFNGDAFYTQATGSATGYSAGALNILVVNGIQKGQGNTQLKSPPVVVQLVAAPNRVYTISAVGDSTQGSINEVAYALSGVSSATLQAPAGGPITVNGPSGSVPVTQTGTYTLTGTGAAPAQAVMIKPTLLIAGADHGAGAYIPVYDAITGALVQTLLAYDPFFIGGARVAMGDVTGAGHPDFIVAAGPGGGPEVKVYDGITGDLIDDFFAYDPRFTGGAYIAAGDVTGTGYAVIVVGADAGGGPNVIVFDVHTGSPTVVLNFFAYNPAFVGGVRVAVGTITKGQPADIITGAGPGGGPEVSFFSYVGGLTPVSDPNVSSFFVLNEFFIGGIYIAAGDLAGIGRDYVVSGPASLGGPNITVFDPTNPSAPMQSFFAYDPGFTGGVRVAASNAQNGQPGLILTGPGPGTGPLAEAFNGVNAQRLSDFDVFDPSQLFGIFVASA